MAIFNSYYVQRAETPKVGQPESRFVLCSARRLILFYICEKFHNNILNGFQLTEWWLGVANVSCIFRQRSVQLILASSWARSAILVADKGRGRGVMFYFFCFFAFIPILLFFHVPLFHLLYYLFYLFSPCLWETTHKGWRVVKLQDNQSNNLLTELTGGHGRNGYV